MRLPEVTICGGMQVETFPAATKQTCALAFEVENAYASPRTIAHLLSGLSGVSGVNLGAGLAKDVRVEFKYQDREYIVWEPFGDNSRYWIGPKNLEESAPSIAQLEDAFRRYQPPWYRAVWGDLLTLRFLRRNKHG